MFRRSGPIVLLCCLFVCVSGKCDLMSVLFTDYDKSQRPHTDGPPVVVDLSIYVSSFGNIEEANMEYKFFGYFRQFWKDERLANRVNHSVILKGDEISRMWRPDPFCYNARKSSLTDADADINSMVTIHPNGDVVYSRMTIITAECELNLHKFPMDEQKCHLKIGSYSYTTQDIKYRWRPPMSSSVDVRNRNLAQFALTSIIEVEYVEHYDLGNFSIIQVEFTFQRRLGYFLIQVYIPSIFVVVLSWIVFWMDKDNMGDRMALGITTVLTIMFLLGAVNASMPRVSYPKALDWYLMVSFTLVFLVLIECMTVFVISKYGGSKKKEKEKKEKGIKGLLTRVPMLENLRKLAGKNENTQPGVKSEEIEVKCVETVEPAAQNLHNSLKEMASSDEKGLPNDSNIDKFSRAAFPLVFVVFNMVYWSVYSNGY
ncbi:gamma-aminobutyric acid receptor alpha-like [Nematostella vectensis]|uniref:gamma-aminobutyric acid receptor alpha-like n=1 Tax=Nematostella vectensis TaxID=45351 RepID=UPI00207755A8|nr:gamma-aminobutyric acid receptor alpha-like [Nematostella vectensis]XP_048585541.1 gamma-aminobutyric acid receptor alpha-like [Nematostella vectensis]